MIKHTWTLCMIIIHSSVLTLVFVVCLFRAVLAQLAPNLITHEIMTLEHAYSDPKVGLTAKLSLCARTRSGQSGKWPDRCDGAILQVTNHPLSLPMLSSMTT